MRIARLARVTQSATLAYPGTLAGYTLVLLCVAAARALALSARPTVEGPLIRMFITHTVHLHPRFAFTFGTGAIIAPLLGIIWAHAAHLRFAFTFGTAAMPAPLLVIIWTHAMSPSIPYDLRWRRLLLLVVVVVFHLLGLLRLLLDK